MDDKVFQEAKAAIESGLSLVEAACLFGYIPNTLRQKLQKSTATCVASCLPAPITTNLKEDIKLKTDESVFAENFPKSSDSTSPIQSMANDDNSPRENGQETENKPFEDKSLDLEEPSQTNSVRIPFPELQSLHVRKLWELRGGKPKKPNSVRISFPELRSPFVRKVWELKGGKPKKPNSVRISFPELRSPFVRKVWELKGGKP